MRMYDIIRKKRDGGTLTDGEIAFFVDGYTKGTIPDYQASAFCMAVFYRGMTERETVTLTRCMAHSGDTMDLSMFGECSVDKHSTGGVGDKTSLIVGPIVAALGGKVTKMSGRGLGHTGGTVDKLESIPGCKTSLSSEEFIGQVEKCGIAVIGQTGNLTPADKKLYALRDVTATVDSIPLITSSIMSKKLAAGSHTIVLDVKVGSGAFMKTPEDAEELARDMVRIGKKCGRNMAALLTDMDRPLGYAVGNSLEVKEAIEVLSGREQGPLFEVCAALAAEMVSLFKKIPQEKARAQVYDAVSSGKALEKMKEWIGAQGGDVSCISDPSRFPTAKFVREVKAPTEGYLRAINAEEVGSAAVVLGAGRASKEDVIDHAAGMILRKTVGDRVAAGQVLCELHSNNEASLDEAERRFLSAIRFGKTKPKSKPLIYKTVR